MNETRHDMIASRRASLEALEARYARRVAARLEARARHTEHHVDERLRVARERALDRARLAAAAAAAPQESASAVTVAAAGGAASIAWGGSATGPDAPQRWWQRLGMLLPLLALVAGLMLIQYQHSRLRTAAVAAVDVDLLVDELPPRAYSDPGFVEFLKTSHEP